MAFVCLMTIAIMGCADHDDMFDSGIRVGNIVLADNTMVTPESYNANTMTPVGVVFYASNDSAWVIAPVELGDYAFSNSDVAITGVSTDTYSMDGLTSTAAMAVSQNEMPAAKACLDYKSALSGWFLPSAGELRMLAHNLDKVKLSMEIIGGQRFDDIQYMSSSQDNSSSSNNEIFCYCVSLLRGYAVSVPKNEAHRVRPAMLIH